MNKTVKQSFRWNKVTPLSKYIAMALFVTLPFFGFVLGAKYQSLLTTTVDPTPTFTTSKETPNTNTAPTPNTAPAPTPVPEVTDDRDCITGEVENSFDEKFFIGKVFVNMAMSGEWGTLQKDHRLPISWGLDYAGPDDDRPNSGIGTWYIESINNELQLSLNSTSISDGVYTKFRYYQYKQNIFAIPLEYKGLVIGPSQSAIDDFYDKKVKSCW